MMSADAWGVVVGVGITLSSLAIGAIVVTVYELLVRALDAPAGFKTGGRA